MSEITKYFRLGDTVGKRSVGPVFGPYEVAVKLPAGAEEITAEEYAAAVDVHRAQAEQWHTAQAEKAAATRAEVYAEALALGFSESAARALSGHGGG